MCTKEEVRELVQQSEDRMKERLEKSHQGIAKTISNFMADFKCELKALSKKADATIINRNSVAMQIKNMEGKIIEAINKIENTHTRLCDLENWRVGHTQEVSNITDKLNRIERAILSLIGIVLTSVLLAVIKLVILG